MLRWAASPAARAAALPASSSPSVPSRLAAMGYSSAMSTCRVQAQHALATGAPDGGEPCVAQHAACARPYTRLQGGRPDGSGLHEACSRPFLTALGLMRHAAGYLRAKPAYQWQQASCCPSTPRNAPLGDTAAWQGAWPPQGLPWAARPASAARQAQCGTVQPVTHPRVSAAMPAWLKCSAGLQQAGAALGNDSD